THSRNPAGLRKRGRAAPCRTALLYAVAESESSGQVACPGKSALRELEAAARLGPAVLLALDHAAVAGQEPGGLDRGTQRRLELGQRLADAVLHCAGLARKPAAGDRGDHVVLALALGDRERLADDQAQRRPREIGFLVAAIDSDLARSGLDPHAGDRILAAAGGIGAALRVEFLFAQRRGGSGGDHGLSGLTRFGGRGVGGGRSARNILQIGEIGNSVLVVSHHLATLFLRFIEATSSATGWVPACGCSVPA